MINLAGIVILAGGESTRMGSPKAKLKVPRMQGMDKAYNQRQISLLDFHIQDTFGLGVPVLVADNNKHFLSDDSYQKTPYLFAIQDHIPSAGALSAITAAIQFLSDDTTYPKKSKSHVLVLSCDTLIHAHHLNSLLSNQSNHWQACYVQDKKGQDYPLLGLYRLDLLPKLQEYLNHGNRSVMKFLSQIHRKVIPMPSDWQPLANFNTPQEFKTAIKHLELSHLKKRI